MRHSFCSRGWVIYSGAFCRSSAHSQRTQRIHAQGAGRADRPLCDV